MDKLCQQCSLVCLKHENIGKQLRKVLISDIFCKRSCRCESVSFDDINGIFTGELGENL